MTLELMWSLFRGMRGDGGADTFREMLADRREWMRAIESRIATIEAATRSTEVRMDKIEQGLTVMTEHVAECSRQAQEAATARRRIEDQQIAVRRELRGYSILLLITVVGGLIATHFSHYW